MMTHEVERVLFSGVLELPWWGYVLAALALTHVTIVAVTVFLHRHQAHRALELHPAISHFFRLWLWLTTGMVTREWVAIHRKHHAKVETVDDPHSPKVWGINRVLWGGVLLYVKEARNPQTLERYGSGTPDDWLERTIYSRFLKLGLTLTAVADLIIFGVVPGSLIFLTQIVWIPFWAAGVINGIGHYRGYRNWFTKDASTNIVPWGILIGGEELHNNHHAFVTSAKLSSKWYEFDIGWMYIRTLEAFGLAKVNRIAPVPQFGKPRSIPDLQTVQAVIEHRYDVMARYAQSLRRTYADALALLRATAPHDARALQAVEMVLEHDLGTLHHADQARLTTALAKSRALHTAYCMRGELVALWEHSAASKEQLVRHLQDWCQRAEASGIAALAQFSRRLRSYE